MKWGIQPSEYNINNSHAELRILQNEGYLFGITFTDKALDLFSLVQKSTKEEPKVVKASISKERIEEYNSIFPKMKAGSGKYMRCSQKNLEGAFKWFFNNYSYDWDVVYKATKLYVTQQERENYKYTRTAMYFIRKQIGGVTSSDLADYCEMIINGYKEEKTDFSEKVV